MAFKEAAIGLSLAQSVFDWPWFVARPIERQATLDANRSVNINRLAFISGN